MTRCAILAACLTLAAVASLSIAAGAQSVSAYQTTPDLLEALDELQTLHFAVPTIVGTTAPLITVDDSQTFQQIDGFGASLTDSAAWLLANKLTPAQADATLKTLFSRRDGIALGFLRQPVGSSDLAVTFYSFDDLCTQSAKACTTPPGIADPGLARFSLAHDQQYILPLLKKALELNPDLRIMLSPWSPPGWMKSSGSMLGQDPATNQPATLRPEARAAFAQYLVKTIQGYQSASVPIYALSVQNEPLYAPSNYSGMSMPAADQADLIGNYLGPALAAANLRTKLLVYDHNWDHPEYPEKVLRDPKAAAVSAGTAWHHYAGDPAVMTGFHEEFPRKDQWVTEASGGTWQKGIEGNGNILAEEAAELIAVSRNWAKSYVLWALATDPNHGPFVGGCDTCRGLVTIDAANPAHPVKREPDYYVLGQASKFVQPGAVRIASNEPPDTQLRDVAFRNPNGTVVLYTLNAATTARQIRIAYKGKTVATTIPAGSVATFIWKP